MGQVLTDKNSNKMNECWPNEKFQFFRFCAYRYYTTYESDISPFLSLFSTLIYGKIVKIAISH